MQSNDPLKRLNAAIESDRCAVMGVLNVTPDSFSDGGKFIDLQNALAHGVKMAQDGAAIIDVGPESSRPGAEPVAAAEQIKRAIPVIEGLKMQTDALISIDTYDCGVAEAALNAGADMINDITALSNDNMAELAAKWEVPVVLMHMKGKPTNMQDSPRYDNVVEDVLRFLLDRAKRAESFGIEKQRIILDPGIGFGKTTEHNLELLRAIDTFVATGYRVLVGTSRKRFIGELTGKDQADKRIFGTAATVALCAAAGVAIVRVHDVPEMIDVIKLATAIS